VFLNRSQIIFLYDLLAVNFSFNIALGIRLLDEVSLYNLTTYIEYSSVFFIISFIGLYYSKLYKRSWRFSSEKDYLFIVQTCLIVTMLYALVMFMVNRLTGIPRSVILMNCILMPMLLSGSRLIYKLIRFNISNNNSEEKVPVLIIGVDDRIELFLREVFFAGNTIYEPVGIIDNNKTKVGSKIYNIEVYGALSQFDQVYAKLKAKNLIPKRLIITDRYSEGDYFKQLIEISDRYGIKLARLPKVTELHYKLNETVKSQPIIIEDLLLREQNFLDHDQVYLFLRNKIILITGAGGTIGAELVRQLANFQPEKLVIIDNSEFNLYKIINQITSLHPNLKLASYIADIRDKDHLERIFDKERPQIIFHAAALKHVPLVEENIIEGIRTNIFGTINIAHLALKHKSESMILISTDKAVNPTNVLGATKRIAEKYIQGIGQKYSRKKTSFVAVRFGNVLGSSGSVIPLFEQQISNGGPVTITDPKITRYFMTLREAVQLVLQAGKLGASQHKDSHGHIYVLDMGKPILIKDLAEQMIKLSGLNVGKDIKIEYIGLRPGEKLYEELFYDSEQPTPTEYESIMATKQNEINFDELSTKLSNLEIKFSSKEMSDQEMKTILKEIIPEYNF
jgi:O-antigen biosynthesis protein WbqV